jgi:hypothetical protein
VQAAVQTGLISVSMPASFFWISWFAATGRPELRAVERAGSGPLEPAVSQSECPVCGALRHQQGRNLAFPQHFAPTHPGGTSGA